MQKKNIYRVIISIFIIIGISCSKYDSLDSEQTEQIQEFDVKFEIINNTNRVQLINRSILPEVTEDYLSSEAQRNVTNESNVTNQQDYFWTWVAKVSSPTLEGDLLSATHCEIKDDRAYVTYHKQGDKHLGMLEIVDISNPEAPVVIKQVSFRLADINSVTVESETAIWLAASHSEHGATVYKINSNIDTFERINLSNLIDEDVVSASANGIAYTDNYLIVSAGKTYGGTFILNKSTFELEYNESYSNAKYVCVNGSSNSATYASLITGDNARVKSGTVNGFNQSNEFDITNIIHTNVEASYRGKNTTYFDPYNSNKLYVSTGLNGLKVYDINSGSLINESKGTMLIEGNTNGVTLDDDYMYIANGADGIAISEHISGNNLINPMFVWDMQEQPASANYVTAKNDWVFICKGQGGFNILYKQDKAPYITISPYNNKGTPIVMEEDEEVCSELLPNLFNVVLPETENALINHPEYFMHPTKNIHIKETAEVTVTFINEGAGYKNVLGYYAYDINTPPQTVDDLVKIVIFPNASAQNSGGELIRGNTMRLLGEFEADTMIGFFVISDGWRNNEITEGIYTQHTDAILNNNSAQQSLIFHDTSCNSTIICFEDISVPNGDKDYNDAIFQIKASPESAIDPSDYIQVNQD